MGFDAWWDPLVRSSAGLAETPLPIGVDWLVQSALQNSSRVQAITTEPYIRRTLIVEEYAQFDWRSFLETNFQDFNDPVGNTLTTGNNDTRYKDRTWSGRGGFRRKAEGGGELDYHRSWVANRIIRGFWFPIRREQPGWNSVTRSRC